MIHEDTTYIDEELPDMPPTLRRNMADPVEDNLDCAIALTEGCINNEVSEQYITDSMKRITPINGLDQWALFEKLPLSDKQRKSVLSKFYKNQVEKAKNGNEKETEEETKVEADAFNSRSVCNSPTYSEIAQGLGASYSGRASFSD